MEWVVSGWRNGELNFCKSRGIQHDDNGGYNCQHIHMQRCARRECITVRSMLLESASAQHQLLSCLMSLSRSSWATMTLTGFVGPGINNRYHAIPEGIRVSVPAVTFRGATGYGLPGMVLVLPTTPFMSVCLSVVLSHLGYWYNERGSGVLK